MKEDLLQIVNRYGVNAQQRKLAEEVFELQEAITIYENDCAYMPELELLNEDKEHMAEEIADVLNIVEQFMYYYDIDLEDVIEIKHEKVKRQIGRITMSEDLLNYKLQRNKVGMNDRNK